MPDIPFTVETFGRIRPFVYHLTSRKNLLRIKQTSELSSAADLMTKAGNTEFLTAKRRESIEINVDGESIHIRDQAPLHEGNIRFDDGWAFGDLIRDLNERVFFWPGTASGPIDYGQRHYERYASEKPIVIRVALRELMDTNVDMTPLFCKYNSGSPRCSGGLGSVRGPDTFVPCDVADFTASAVVEVTYRDSVALPNNCKRANSLSGPWKRLW